MEAESSLAAMFGGFLEDALLCACRSRKDEEFSIGEDAVNVEEQESDFAGASLSGEFPGHWGDFSRWGWDYGGTPYLSPTLRVRAYHSSSEAEEYLTKYYHPNSMRLSDTRPHEKHT